MNTNNQAYQIKEKLASLEAALLEQTPDMPQLLRDIHRTLKADPDVVTILSEKEVSVLVRVLKKQTNTEIATTAAKKKPKKALKNLTVEDL